MLDNLRTDYNDVLPPKAPQEKGVYTQDFFDSMHDYHLFGDYHQGLSPLMQSRLEEARKKRLQPPVKKNPAPVTEATPAKAIDNNPERIIQERIEADIKPSFDALLEIHRMLIKSSYNSTECLFFAELENDMNWIPEIDSRHRVFFDLTKGKLRDELESAVNMYGGGTTPLSNINRDLIDILGDESKFALFMKQDSDYAERVFGILGSNSWSTYKFNDTLAHAQEVHQFLTLQELVNPERVFIEKERMTVALQDKEQRTAMRAYLLAVEEYKQLAKQALDKAVPWIPEHKQFDNKTKLLGVFGIDILNYDLNEVDFSNLQLLMNQYLELLAIVTQVQGKSSETQQKRIVIGYPHAHWVEAGQSIDQQLDEGGPVPLYRKKIILFKESLRAFTVHKTESISDIPATEQQSTVL